MDQFFKFISHLGFFDEATFTVSNKGKSKLMHNGFGYVKHTASRFDVTYWRCEFRSCRGKAQTKNNGTKHFVKLTGIHNHLPTHGSRQNNRSKLNADF